LQIAFWWSICRAYGSARPSGPRSTIGPPIPFDASSALDASGVTSITASLNEASHLLRAKQALGAAARFPLSASLAARFTVRFWSALTFSTTSVLLVALCVSILFAAGSLFCFPAAAPVVTLTRFGPLPARFANLITA
jgi:hypothetical protein